ncbi:MAG TPA: hypothetical protein VFE31_09040 [Opitutaceae bacterium]|jgi:hypothetical protein|nr:hypothetical protein [Opitutaceae bacterium]
MPADIAFARLRGYQEGTFMSPPPHDGGARPPGPYWKRAHKDPKAWVAFAIIMIAMLIFVFSDGFALSK